MLESTRECLRDLNKQFHDDRVSAIDLEKAIKQQKQEEQWAQERKAAEAAKKARDLRYQRGDFTESERSAFKEGLRECAKVLGEQTKKSAAEEAHFWDNFNRRQAAQEGRGEIERLLEIAEDRNDYLSGRLREAEAQGNEELVAQYTQEKAENDKNLELYRGKYEEYKAAAEG